MRLTIHYAFSLTLLFISSFVLASPELIIASSFNIKAVNGTIYSSGIINQDRRIKLRPGKNLLAIEYEEVFDDENGDSFDVIKSSPFLLTVYLNKDTVYQQKIVKPSNAGAARKFINNPLFQIINTSNKKQTEKVSFKLVPLISDKKSYLVYQTRLRQNDTLDLSHPNPKSSNINKQNLIKSNQQSMPSKMLNYWWQQASPEEKEQFLNAIKGTDKK
ncbi:DUF2057 family protein [Aliikangiella sp. IMCC44359]|uniref:DUF2057 family protein n=1 Tax=Aliikangiella sp. IMCC44359 TaxID=3459125 RepID=UPI00403B064B